MSTNKPKRDPARANRPPDPGTADDVAGQFAARLHRTRKERDLTLRDVALESGVSIAYLSDLERGKLKNPTLDVLRKIAQALRVSVDSLLGDETSDQPDASPRPKNLETFLNSPAFARAVGDLADRWQGDAQELRQEWARVLAEIQVAGRRPKSEMDWMFVFESIRRAVDT